ncbi:ATP-binding protein [Aliamphritea spongicola]|uniref:ATP-binding protein n=1 Tax=Aliamphritea spongicola TaxID=707589 RepID=UPI00196B53D4|nr:ATP-binding protein [Aliamphritea spongicola]MBN3562694.1 ATP-binding protein [Aliamphritea spongicola]
MSKHQQDSSVENGSSAAGLSGNGTGNVILPFRMLAPRPTSVEETFLNKQFLVELISKHLYDAGGLTISQLVHRVCLCGSIIEELLNYLRQESRLEVLPRLGQSKELYYSLTDLGRIAGQEAMDKNGYIGPAPVPVSEYEKVVQAQSVHRVVINQKETQLAFEDIVIKDSLLDQLGPAMNSGRSIVIYGPPGTGKTYISQRLTRLLTDVCLIPYAISVNESIIQLYDPLVHKTADQVEDHDGKPNLLFNEGHDPRYKLCKRPVVISGGELTLDMLEVTYEPSTKIYRAPLQLKANNGMYIIDDMGRQRVSPVALFNRWIYPMEERKDLLSLANGNSFEVPFDEILIFSTNINPLELGDAAFLRRIGHKIHFDTLDQHAFTEIWKNVCIEKQIEFDQSLLTYIFKEHYQREQRPLLPCHPRDILGIAQDKALYLAAPEKLSEELIDWAWKSYFVKLDQEEDQFAGQGKLSGGHND